MNENFDFNITAVFDAFYRKNPCDGGYAIFAGLQQVIEYIKGLSFSYDDVQYLRSLGIFGEDFLNYLAGFHFTGSIYAIPEGTVVFPKEPLVKVIAPIMEAQLVETAILNIVNHQSLIATKASRVVYVAGDDTVMVVMRDNNAAAAFVIAPNVEPSTKLSLTKIDLVALVVHKMN